MFKIIQYLIQSSALTGARVRETFTHVNLAGICPYKGASVTVKYIRCPMDYSVIVYSYGEIY